MNPQLLPALDCLAIDKARDHKMITTLRNHKNTHTHTHALYTCPQVLVEVRCDLESSWSLSFFLERKRKCRNLVQHLFLLRWIQWTEDAAGTHAREQVEERRRRRRRIQRSVYRFLCTFWILFLKSLWCFCFTKLLKQGNDRILPSFFFVVHL